MNVTMRKIHLKSSRPVLMFGLCLGSERIAEMVSDLPVDVVMVDLQHSHLDKTGATNCIRTLARNDGPVPVARVSDCMSGMVNSMLDAGAMGVIFPMVQNRAEAEQAVDYSYYPPQGHRSKSGVAAVFYGPEYADRINRDVSVIVMIETPEAAGRAGEILSVAGISGCLIGASDLSFNLKQQGQLDRLPAIVESIVKVGAANNIPIGISVGSPEELKRWWNAGVDFFLISHDMGVLSKALAAHVEEYVNSDIQTR